MNESVSDQLNDSTNDKLLSHPDLEAEQAYLDFASECLAAMKQRAQEMIDIGDRAVRDEESVDARVIRQHLGKRADALEKAGGPLCFGRIDTDKSERWYVGRRHIEEADNKPVVVDWRAPVAAGYYRATAVDPVGLTFRRRFSVADNRIEAIFDEDLSDPENMTATGIPDPLLAELDRSRSGQMSDIVATIAAEQDIIIRAPLEQLLIVQGGPGTGKTAVGLHRAAFLLYQHRLKFLDSNVLVLGPNPLFLRYIADVLPSLGETSVRQTTLAGLVSAKYRIRAVDSADIAELKGRPVMAKVVEQAIRTRIVAPADGLQVRTGIAVVRFEASDLESMMKTILDRSVPVNDGRDVFRRMVMAEAWRRYSSRSDADPGYEPIFAAGLRSSDEFKKAIEKMWPRLNPVAVVRGLYTSPNRLKAASEGLLTSDEQQLLSGSRSSLLAFNKSLNRSSSKSSVSNKSSDPWTAADLALLDECEVRCNGVPQIYEHVIVDEAQDLSAMALRMIGRRVPSGSMTILGDLAQATMPGAPGSWTTTIENLVAAAKPSDSDDGFDVQVAELTVGYRVPAAILEVANRLLPVAAPTVTPAGSVRPGGYEPHVVRTEGERLSEAVVAEVATLAAQSQSIAVIASDRMVDDLVGVISAAGIACDQVGGAGLPGKDAVAVLNPLAAKGLEFDAVVVVEPAEIAAMPSGLRHLYVAMTRPVQFLGLVAAKPLPELLELGD